MHEILLVTFRRELPVPVMYEKLFCNLTTRNLATARNFVLTSAGCNVDILLTSTKSSRKQSNNQSNNSDISNSFRLTKIVVMS